MRLLRGQIDADRALLEEWADESAPCGNHRNWKRFDEFWREKGKAQFEEWLRERGSGAS